jgi:DNA-binding HxlR family transcriptional regulator
MQREDMTYLRKIIRMPTYRPIMSDDEDVDWNSVAAVRASTTRRRVVEALEEEPKYAAEVSKEIGAARGMVSNTFRWLREHELATAVTPDRPHHILYALTEKGEAVAENV